MRCIFVLDIFNGAVVHAVRGERSRYELIERSSKIVSTSEPLGVLDAIKPKEVYIADLNRLIGSGDNLEAIRAVSRRAKTIADVGVSNLSHLDLLPEGVTAILGTETASLGLIKEAARRRKIVASLDMKNGKVLTSDQELVKGGPLQVLRELSKIALEAVILLDLDRVGASTGLDKEFLENAAQVCTHSLILGGGIRSVEDITALKDLGFSGALMATAVHNGRIPLEMMR